MQAEAASIRGHWHNRSFPRCMHSYVCGTAVARPFKWDCHQIWRFGLSRTAQHITFKQQLERVRRMLPARLVCVNWW